MCIEFSKPSGSYDFFSPILNCVGNAIVVGAAAITAAVIVDLALNALGYSGRRLALGSTALYAIGSVSLAVAAAGTLVIGAIFYVIFSALWSR